MIDILVCLISLSLGYYFGRKTFPGVRQDIKDLVDFAKTEVNAPKK